MFLIFNFNRLENENEEQYLWRIGQAKDNCEIDITWNEIASHINRLFRKKEIGLNCIGESYRKVYQSAKKLFDAGAFTIQTDEKQLSEVIHKIQELKRQQVKIKDERTEYNRLVREYARLENFIEQIITLTKENISPIEYDFNSKLDMFNDDLETTDLIASFSDVHTGIQIDNYFNKFDEVVLKDRIFKYLKKIFKIQMKHNAKTIHLILSELLSGIIHLTLRIENNKDLIQQFLIIIEYLSEFISELSYSFENVYVYMCQGNHSRISPNKKESINGENMDLLALPFLSAKLQNFNNVHFVENDKIKDVVNFTVRNQLVMASHGNIDTPKTVVQNFTMMFNKKPDLVYLFHRHKNGMSTIYDTKVIESGCMSGTDQFCISNRIKNRPEQTVSIINNAGLDCVYDVKLD